MGAFAFRCDDCVPNFHRSGQQPTPQDEFHPRTSICHLTAEGKHAAKPKNTINDRCTGASTRRALHSNPILHTPHAPPTFGFNARFSLNYNPHCVPCRAAGCSMPSEVCLGLSSGPKSIRLKTPVEGRSLKFKSP